MLRFITTIIVALAALSAQAAVDVNKASQADLEGIRGVGPALSGKILEARKSGEFRHWGDFVERVSGVGPASAARLSQAGLTVSGAAYDGSAPAAKGRPVKGGAAGEPKPAKAEKVQKADSRNAAPAR